jgi:peroxiredoxin
LVAVAVVGVVGAFLFLGGRSSSGGAVTPMRAPGFTLPSTAGGRTSLSDFAGHNVLLYFNEGVGCDACFYQTEELEKSASEFAAKDIQVVPIVMNPIDQVRSELARFSIKTPYLVDDGTVSSAYGVLGKGMHANLPGHGFVFIDKTGKIRWEKEYPSMYASAGEVLGAISKYV